MASTPAARVRRAKKRLTDAIHAYYAAVEELDDDEDARENSLLVLHRDLAGTGGMAEQLAWVADDLGRRVNEIVCAIGDENNRLVVPGVGTVEATWTGKRTVWSQHGQILSRISARAVDLSRFDPATGEAREEPMPPAALAALVAEEVADCAGLLNASATWRKGALEKRGIDPAQYTDRVGESRPGAKWVG